MAGGADVPFTLSVVTSQASDDAGRPVPALGPGLERPLALAEDGSAQRHSDARVTGCTPRPNPPPTCCGKPLGPGGL